MHNRRRWAAGLFGILLAAGWLQAGAASHGSAQNISISDGDEPLERCDQLEITFGNRPAARDEERLQVASGNDPLRIHLTSHGGIALREGPGPQHDITVCKAAPEDAGADLSAIRGTVNGSSVNITGPAGRSWVAYLIVRSPKGSRLDLSAVNGPIRADSFEGQLAIRTVNGPIALEDVRGQVSARAENGPVKLRGDGGRIDLETQNGPVGVHLTGDRWRSGELVARAHNGPLSLALPAGYQSGVDVQSSGHGPWSCRGASDCGSWLADEGGRRVRLGQGPVQVRLSTVNGPVKVNVRSN